VSGELLSSSVAAGAGVPGVSHVVVLGFDGLYPPGVERGKTPVMHELMRRGTYSLQARGVLPNNSSPNWASMIMGAGPTDHGVTSNDWEPDHYDIPPVCVGSGGVFPTIFGVLRGQRPNAISDRAQDGPAKRIRPVQRSVARQRCRSGGGESAVFPDCSSVMAPNITVNQTRTRRQRL
jgi:hypothetical protein